MRVCLQKQRSNAGNKRRCHRSPAKRHISVFGHRRRNTDPRRDNIRLHANAFNERAGRKISMVVLGINSSDSQRIRRISRRSHAHKATAIQSNSLRTVSCGRNNQDTGFDCACNRAVDWRIDFGKSSPKRNVNHVRAIVCFGIPVRVNCPIDCINC